MNKKFMEHLMRWEQCEKSPESVVAKIRHYMPCTCSLLSITSNARVIFNGLIKYKSAKSCTFSHKWINKSVFQKTDKDN